MGEGSRTFSSLSEASGVANICGGENRYLAAGSGVIGAMTADARCRAILGVFMIGTLGSLGPSAGLNFRLVSEVRTRENRVCRWRDEVVTVDCGRGDRILRGRIVPCFEKLVVSVSLSSALDGVENG